MEWIRANLPITLGFVLSLLLHLFLFLPAAGLLGRDATASAERAALRGSELEVAARGQPRKDDARSRARSADNARKALQERRDRQDPIERRDEEVRLGIDRSSANTLNWIGYEEYERHLAELADVEQAAYRLTLASGSRGDASPLLPPAPPAPSVAVSPDPSPLPLPAAAPGSESETEGAPAASPPAAPPATPPASTVEGRDPALEPAQPLPPPEMAASPEQRTDAGRPDEQAPRSDDPDAPAVAPDAATEADADDSKKPPIDAPPSPLPVVRPADGTRPAPQPTDPTRTDPSSEPRTDPTADPAPDPAAPAPSSEPKEPPADPLEPMPPVEQPTTPTEREPAKEPTPGSEGAGERTAEEIEGDTGGGIEGPVPTDGATNQPAAPSPSGDPGETTAKRGELSDRESDATSIIEVPMNAWQLGRPLAAQGIVLRPVRPRFTVLNRLDGIARNPIGEIVLGRDGVPISARVVRSTGNPGVDQAIRSALFKWRASGEQLEKLKPGQTLTIRLRLIMMSD